jgi:peptidoglycan/xylan/chitin deacetylase (PgdA/CDA1 family)
MEITYIRRLSILAAPLALVAALNAAQAADCPGNPRALGTSRTIVVDPVEHTRIGGMNYGETLPLADKEVVLTFDDGPLPPYSDRILDILASECVRATYFIVGRMARAYPELVRRAHAEGHTIGTHSMNHPIPFRSHGFERSKTEIEGGIAATGEALGGAGAVAPFFRFPGLGRTDPVEAYLGRRGLMAWSADFPADDWRRIKANEIIRRALMRLEAKGRGILLLHDVQPATALALPSLLAELKARGYRIVHVQPAGKDRPKTATLPQDWLVKPPRRPVLPALSIASLHDLDGEFAIPLDPARLCQLPSPGPAVARRGVPVKAAAARQAKRLARPGSPQRQTDLDRVAQARAMPFGLFFFGPRINSD